jgi:hypothetical protein
MMEPTGVRPCGAIGLAGYEEPAQACFQWSTMLLLEAIT